MVGFEKCCYYVDLSLGCYIIGWFYLVFSILGTLGCGLDFRYHQARLCYLAWGDAYSLNAFTRILFAAAAIMSGLMIFFAGIFIYGLNSDNGHLLLLFIGYLAWYHAVNFLLLMLAACYAGSSFIFFLALLCIGAGVLWMLTVYSEYTIMPTEEEEEEEDIP